MATVGNNFSQQLTPTGGSGSGYAFTPSELPDWLTLSPAVTPEPLTVTGAPTDGCALTKQVPLTAICCATDGAASASLVRSSAVMALGTLASRLTGMVRTVVLVPALGAYALANAYNVSNTLPNTVYNLAKAGKTDEAFELYRWFLPLLRLDTVPKFVQLIKWVQEQTGVGCARFRPPRLEIIGEELEIAGSEPPVQRQ